MRLFLIGMPGAGKTTLGRALALRGGLPFLDLDEEIVRQEQRSVAEIFSAEGEAYFRAVEARLVRQLIEQHPQLVLATGGGAPCFHDTMDALLASGVTVWLDVPVPELVARLHRAAAARPLLAALPDEQALKQRLTETIAARRGFYSRAALRCAPPACTPDALWALVQHYQATA
ncbi:shikimate kinase [Hymenobacter guriensis]|uniref:Shikimate kinase n=1 Tax=Hymenobacter guriensis TaxID=2793065 RepID=A0ABS0L7V7_9BACT|nr:shikimate kinase [Hymenobacter guriensis]MBG8556192.1 shikimate kinase [Hymenobacter guriensis]